MKPFGIRVVIIEPGFIRTNIASSSILAKKALDTNSPYFSFTQKLANHINSMINNTSTSTAPEEVARTILDSITSKNPKLRYTVGNDADSIMKAKRNMPDEEFTEMIKKQFR